MHVHICPKVFVYSKYTYNLHPEINIWPALLSQSSILFFRIRSQIYRTDPTFKTTGSGSGSETPVLDSPLQAKLGSLRAKFSVTPVLGLLIGIALAILIGKYISIPSYS